MITFPELEQPRSPSDLRKFVVQLVETVKASESERHRGILKEGLYKKFLDELIPLSRFAICAYPGSYKVQLVLGNQGYDALVFSETGKEVDRIEITIPHDGDAKAKDARLIVDRGYGQIHVGEPGDDFDALFPHVLATCQKKAQKDYGDCTLVVTVAPMPPFQSFEPRYEKQIESLVQELSKIKFKAKRVFLLVLPDKVFDVAS